MRPGRLRRRRAPRLSVVVPVYNVENYLADCLDSVLAQRFDGLEVILVDDGSTDGSTEIARAYADQHPGWRLVRTDNHGLGAARNRGVREATGEYLAFVDSDDLLPDGVYHVMAATLDESGSDFVVGSVQQLVDGRLVEPVFLRRGVERRRIGVRACEVPPIVRNVFAWNKMFRRSFYEQAGIRFPEGVRYEDQPAMMRAYLSADRFDILRRPVYTWRVRTDGSSITQGRARLADLEDRLHTKQLTTDVVRELGDPTVVDFWGRLALVGDLPVYFAEIPNVDDAYWARLVAGLRELLHGFPPIEDSLLRLPQRLLGWLVVQDRRADAERVLRWLDDHPGPLDLQVVGDHVVARGLPIASDGGPEVPSGVRRLCEHELEYDARLVDARWDGTSLVVTGWALVRGAPTSGVPTRVDAWLEPVDEAAGKPVLNGHVERFAAPEATRWVDRGSQGYDDSGFTARFELGDWAALPLTERAELTLALRVQVGGVVRSGRLRSRVSRVSQTPDAVPAAPTGFAALAWSADTGLVLRPQAW